jgi:hypothetical protein
MLNDNINEQNAAVAGWFAATLRQIKTRYMQMIHSANRSGDGLDSLRSSTSKSYGEIDRGGFKFERYLIFAHKGAGKGQGGSKGSQWYDPHGVLKSTNPLSLGKMNTGSRRAEEWLNPVLDDEVPKLADIVADFKANAVIKQIQIK